MPAAVNRNRLQTYLCGPCGTRVASVLFEPTGKRMTIERAPMGDGRLAIVLMLPGFERRPDDLPRVVPTRAGTGYREHLCTSEAPELLRGQLQPKEETIMTTRTTDQGCWRKRECCLEGYMRAAVYFGEGELTEFKCDTHGEVRVRSDQEAAEAHHRNDARGGLHVSDLAMAAALATENGGAK